MTIQNENACWNHLNTLPFLNNDHGRLSGDLITVIDIGEMPEAMMRKPQQRTLHTRAKLVQAATNLVDAQRFEAVRVEKIVGSAGVAKGTFFAHFPDKDTLMNQLIGRRLEAQLDAATAAQRPQTVPQIIAALGPFHDAMTTERNVFDIELRYFGAAAFLDIEPIAVSFGRYLGVTADWLGSGPIDFMLAA